MADRLQINLFGACIVRTSRYEITGTKHRALFALLATAPHGRRTRAWLQDTLWGTSCYDSGRQSLRRALSDIKQLMGADFERLLAITNAEIGLDLAQVDFIGRPGGADFLEGMDIRDDGFNAWLSGIRLNPAQIHSLFGLARSKPVQAVHPVVAILPFRALTEERAHAMFGDWLAEEVARNLSRSRLVNVISHLSSRRIDPRLIDLGIVSRQLGADYCVTGTVRPDGSGVIVDADFIDVRSGQILWTRRHAGSVAGFYGADSDPVNELARSIQRAIATDSLAKIAGQPAVALEDRHLLVGGISLLHELRIKDFARSRVLLEETIRRAPLSAEAHAWLGEWHLMSIYNGWSTDRARDIATALDCTARALDIDPESAFALTIDGAVHNSLMHDLDTADARFAKALDINPNESLASLLKGVLHAHRDEGEQAVGRTDRAMQLTPIDPFMHFYESMAASANIAADDFERAHELADRSLRGNDRHMSTLRAKICASVNLGRMAEARADAATLLTRLPAFNIRDYLATHPAAQSRFGRKHADALRAAGVPEEPR